MKPRSDKSTSTETQKAQAGGAVASMRDKSAMVCWNTIFVRLFCHVLEKETTCKRCSRSKRDSKRRWLFKFRIFIKNINCYIKSETKWTVLRCNFTWCCWRGTYFNESCCVEWWWFCYQKFYIRSRRIWSKKWLSNIQS